MPDEPTNNTPAPDAGKSSNNTPSNDKGTDNKVDPIQLAKRVGELEVENKKLAEYKTQVDPILETMASDPELLAHATRSVNKRRGVPMPEDNKDDKNKDTTTKDDKTTIPSNNAEVNDLRLSQINTISQTFEEKVGIANMPAEDKTKTRNLVGQMLKEMVDPKGNKTMQQVWEEISLTKLPWYLERAYDLVSKDTQIKAAEERGKNSVLEQYEGDRGAIGSMPSGSAATEEVTLTPQERAIAQKQGVKEEDYLKYKKQIAAARA